MKFNNLAWCLRFLLVASAFSLAQSNPVPFVNQPLVPTAVAPGAPDFTLTVSGANFVPSSVVNWNGTALATTFVSQAKLIATVPAANVASETTASVTVSSPAPGGGTSNVAFFIVHDPTSSPTFTANNLQVQSPVSVVAADFNNDGKLDLAVVSKAPAPTCNYFGGVGSIAILLGNGDGTFTQTSTLCFLNFLGTFPEDFMIAADYNGDGRIDLIAESTDILGEDNIAVYFGNGDGTFSAPEEIFDQQIVLDFALGDFDRIGQLSSIVSFCDDFGFCSIVILPSYSFLFSSYLVPTAQTLGVGGFIADGRIDVAAPPLGVFLNDGNGAFTLVPGLSQAAQMAIADFNGDGILDVAAADSNSILIYLGNGDGTFTLKNGQPILSQPGVRIIAADFNADRRLDLAIGDSAHTVSIYLGNGDGTFQPGLDTSGRGDSALAFGDFNGDGLMDLVVASSTNNVVSVLLQNAPPPLVRVFAHVKKLCPPNDKMLPVIVRGRIIDTGSGVNESSAAYAVIDEYGQVQQSGSITLGPGGRYSFIILLPASRAETDKHDRRYTVTVSAKNDAGNVGSASTVVTVPHDEELRRECRKCHTHAEASDHEDRPCEDRDDDPGDQDQFHDHDSRSNR
ncbi:MAG TPA: VCBS repeat-containing protein [Terriglobales bacterium]|nr:VCBS repeat-containing protein [Terriglobales bacterium]